MFKCNTCLVTVLAKKNPGIHVAFYYYALPLLRQQIWQVLSIIILHSKFIFDIVKFLYNLCIEHACAPFLKERPLSRK